MSEKVESVFPLALGSERTFDPALTVEVTFLDSPTIVATEVIKVIREKNGTYWLIQADGGACEVVVGYTHIQFSPPRE